MSGSWCLIVQRGGLGGVVGGLRSLVFHSSYDVLVGRQLGGALTKVAVADRVVVGADDLLVAGHSECGRVYSSAEERRRTSVKKCKATQDGIENNHLLKLQA